MSSAVVSTSAAHGRPFLFDAEPEPQVDSHLVDKSENRFHHNGFQSTIKNQQSKILPSSVTPASRLEVRPALAMASSGIAELDALTGGLPRGCLTEICGPTSSGRTTVLLSALAAAARRGEYCALIDASDALDPRSLDAAGVDLDRLLWVRCNEESPRRPRKAEKKKSQESGMPQLSSRLREVGSSEHCLEQVLRATDLLLESGGFGLIILDLADIPPQSARRIPLTTWFRFRRAVEHKPTILLAIEQQPIAGSCSSLQLKLAAAKRRKNTAHACDSESLDPTHAYLLSGFEITVEVIRSRIDRKPAQSMTFDTKTAWAG